MENLVGVQPIIDIITLILQSAFLKPYHPLSLLFISKPESAKTTSILQFKNLDFVYYVNEITAKTMIDLIFPLARKMNVRCILIPDILNCIEKQLTTRQQFLNTVKALIEEGIDKIHTFQKHYEIEPYEEPIRMGIITAITTENYQQTKKYLRKIGLLSRFVPFSFRYPSDLLKRIFQAIEGGEVIEGMTIKTIIKEDKEIKGDIELFKEFEMISRDLGRQYSGYGIRIQRNLQNLAKANAMLNGRDTVIKEDIDKVVTLSRWINYNMNYL
jgi:uncharacterized protein YlzI (FlbEa/FlbD family)